MDTSQIYDVIIVGAGASGLLCALECARAQKRVLVLEKEPLIGRKILASGNGRCNFTNSHAAPVFYHGDTQAVASALKQFSPQDCLRYFDALGVLYHEEERGRYFPDTGKATAITDALKAALAQIPCAEILCNQEVVRVQANVKNAGENLFCAHTSQNRFYGKNLVLACGSRAYPQVSGTARGYELAAALGHSIISPLPALSGLVLKENFSRLLGIRTTVQLTAHTTPTVHETGEIIFTAYGINGPAALNVSSAISRALKDGPVSLEINFLPQLENVSHFLEERLEKFSARKPKDFFAGVLHESLANLLIDFKGLRKNKPMKEQAPFALKNAFAAIEKWPATVQALRPWQEAMVATGGVNVREINYNSFESRCCPHLYVTGELLDVDGQSGGFNLQFAWASGFCAARAITKE